MIYLDANATASMRPAVQAAMARLLADSTQLRNASSVHSFGRKSRALLRRARRDVLSLLGLQEHQAQLVFTSGGTEACNLMVHGLLGEPALVARHPGKIVCSAIEHPAVLEPCKRLEEFGWQVEYLKPDSEGIITVETCAAAVDPMKTALVAVMAANNETGAIQPVAEIAKRLRDEGFSGVLVSDIVQSVGKSACNIAEFFAAGVDAVAVSGHKLGAPAGVGAVVFNANSERCLQVYPHMLGGPQEERTRGGTENLLGIAAFGVAAEAVLEAGAAEQQRIRDLRETLWRGLHQRLPGLQRIGPLDQERLLSNTLLVRLPGCRGDDLVAALDIHGVAASTGSACSSGKQEVSHVIAAMPEQDPQAPREALRFSLDWDCNDELIAKAIERAASAMQQALDVASTEPLAAGAL